MERSPLAAVLLAAGASRRFGADNKLLARIDGVPLLRRNAAALLAAGVSPLVVVTGADPAGVADALAGMPVAPVANPRWEAGMGGSIAVGVLALPETAQGAFVVPGDLACLRVDAVRRLSAAFFDAGGRRVIVPVTRDGAQRNPVLWPRTELPRLAALSGEEGGKSLLDTLAGGRLDVAFDDAGLFADIDTPADLARAIARMMR